MALEVHIRKKLQEYTMQVDFTTENGCLGILGASGCGKSMTLKSIAGVVTPDQGRIVLDGKVLFDSAQKINLKPQQRRVGYLFQNYALFPNMTVAQNIAAGLKLDKAAAKQRTEAMIHRFHLEGLEDRYPTRLSGGQQQRVALARILAYEPDIILLDEPFSAMDAHLREGLHLELKKELERFGGISIMVSHDREEAYKLSDQLMVMDQGTVLQKKATKALFEDPEICEAARITGCKNIVKAEKCGESAVWIPQWQTQLQTGREIPDNITAIGVRAHDFHAVGPAAKNVIPVCVQEEMETPFEWNVLFRLRDGAEDARIWWKIAKEQLPAGDRWKPPEYLAVDKHKILLLTENNDRYASRTSLMFNKKQH